jgi:hypothetical protein
MRYYDLKRYWRKVKPHLDNPLVQSTLVTDFNKFTFGRWEQRFLPGMLPCQFESCDWASSHRGRRPAYWSYTKHAACHWLVNFELELAQCVLPDSPWRIISSDAHSTVWDGAELLFNFTWQALGLTPEQCFTAAYEGDELAVGEHLSVAYADHYSVTKITACK